MDKKIRPEQTAQIPVNFDANLEEAPKDMLEGMYVDLWMIGYPDRAWDLYENNLVHTLSNLEILDERDEEDEQAVERIFNDPGCRHVKLNGSFVVLGSAYGREGFEDDTTVVTSPICAIDKVGYDRAIVTPHGRIYQAPGAVLLLTTCSGSEYYCHEYFYRHWIFNEQYYPFRARTHVRVGDTA